MKIIITGDFPDEEIDSMEVESGVI
jgi:hypothetical protein